MATTVTGVDALPLRGERGCPKLDVSEPRNVLRYFEDLDRLFGRHSITDEQERKIAAAGYAPPTHEETWRCLPSFAEATVPYTTWKAEVLQLYPGTTADRKWSVADLDVITGARAR